MQPCKFPTKMNVTILCTTIQPNPDVTGTGVRTRRLSKLLFSIVTDISQIRASIYALSLGGRIFELVISQIAGAEDCKEFKSAVESALGVQGLALLCTAIYQTFRHNLTLFHAICVIHLLAL